MGCGLEAARLVWEGQTPFHNLCLGEHPQLGQFVRVDGRLRACQSDVPFYHELMVHPALLAHRDPARVLILGGPDGAALREVLRHSCVQEVILVERDERLVQLCRQFAPELHQQAHLDPRCSTLLVEPLQGLEDVHGYFDVIICDQRPAPGRWGDWQRKIRQRLALGGIFVAQVGRALPGQLGALSECYRHSLRGWKKLCLMAGFVPGQRSLWCFLIHSDTQQPSELGRSYINNAIALRDLRGLLNYDGEVHEGACYLPRYLRQALKASG